MHCTEMFFSPFAIQVCKHCLIRNLFDYIFSGWQFYCTSLSVCFYRSLSINLHLDGRACGGGDNGVHVGGWTALVPCLSTKVCN